MLTAILGASDNPDRYSFKANAMLTAHQRPVVLITPKYSEIDGVRCFKALADVAQPIDTVTVYVNPSLIAALVADILAVKPRRVIFNPGSESRTAAAQLRAGGVEVVEACTLVMLSTGQY